MKKWLAACLLLQSLSMTALADNVDALLNNLHSLSAHFTQTLNIPGQTPQESTGQVYISQPNQFRWQVKTPNAQLFVSDGTMLWNDEEDLQQVTVRPLDKSLSATPLLLLSGRSHDVQAVFNIKALGEGGYEFTPKASDDLLKSIELHFKGETPVSLHIVNSLGQTTDITFSNISLNPRLSPDLFHFVPSKEDDILKVN